VGKQVLACMPRTVTVTGTTDSRILEATIELIGELGYKGTTTRQIAGRAGVNEVTLFRRFGTKETLVGKAVPFAQNQLRTAFDNARREKSGQLGVDLTNLSLSMMKILSEKRETVVAMMFEAKREKYVMGAAESMIRFVLGFIGEFLESYESENKLKKDVREMVSLSLTSFIFFRVVVRERLLEKEFAAKNRKGELEEYVKFLLRNITPRVEPRRRLS